MPLSRRRVPSAGFAPRRLRPLVEALDRRVLLSGAHDHGSVVDTFAPATVALTRPGAFLTDGAVSGKARDRGLTFLRSVADDLGVTGAELATPFLTARYSDAPGQGGATHHYFRQEFNGLPVLNATANVSVDPAGRVLAAASSFARQPAEVGVARPGLSADAAFAHAYDDLGLEGAVPANAKLAYVAGANGTMTQVWHAVVDLPGFWHELGVSTADGAVLFDANYTHELAQYEVYPLPLRSPADGVRSVLVDPADPFASPYGWHDAGGADLTVTRGNNVSAGLDRASPNGIDAGGYVADGGPGLDFTFPINPSLAPTDAANQPAHLTQLFYLSNALHDVTYAYGFTEAAGNFQADNYGSGGLGGDALLAEAQDYSGTNNANMGTPADGSSPRMQMYLWTAANPDRDSGLDAEVVAHEYTHGISNRLTGGPANAGALSATQSGGMGEGWSDFVGLILTQKSTDTRTTRRGVGTYLRNEGLNGNGIRAFPYSTDTAVNPLTIDDYNRGTAAVHYSGTLWCTALWDMTWNLIDAHGFTGDLQAGYQPGGAGNALALQLVLNGMKLQPANPSFSDARDAILQADLALTGGANQNLIWSAFAKRGMGASFDAGNNAFAERVRAAFDLPSDLPRVVSQATVPYARPADATSARFEFDEPMDPASFSVADDVLSFAAADGADLKTTITNATWSADNRVLTLSFAPVPTVGTSVLTLSPDLSAADGGLVDQDVNGATGEAADRNSVSLVVQPVTGPDGFGYRAAADVYAPTLLTPGVDGAIDTGLNGDDASVVVPLGANAFSFYGQTYTQLGVNSNGLIVLGFTGTPTTSFSNSNLAGSPGSAALAVLWDDLSVQRDATDRVVYDFQDRDGDGETDALTVQWDAYRWAEPETDTPSLMTFQATLELNTGSAPGAVTYTYVDLVAGNTDWDEAGGATVGVKAAGNGNRLLLAQNDPLNKYARTGRAVRIAPDVEAPRVASRAFEFEAGQRARFALTEPLASAPTAADVELRDTATNALVPASAYAVSYDAATNTLALSSTTLPDGDYRATLKSANLRDAAGLALDGDGDFLQGGDATLDFFVLAGDANRDRAVTFADLSIVASNYGQAGRTFSQGNFDYDAAGAVGFSDLSVLAARYGTALPAARPAPARTSVARVADGVLI